MKIQVKELNLGDVVRVFTDKYSDCTVYRKDTEGNVSVWRPYVKTDDVSYSGGNGALQVIPSIGLEDFSLYNTSEVELVYRNPTPIR